MSPLNHKSRARPENVPHQAVPRRRPRQPGTRAGQKECGWTLPRGHAEGRPAALLPPPACSSFSGRPERPDDSASKPDLMLGGGGEVTGRGSAR